jgi:glutathione-regulated potassium-efflux system ancillary protein KefC
MSFLASVLMGIGLSTSSLAIVFPILREKGLLEKDSGQLLLAGAMVADVISMLVLSLVLYQPSIKSFLVSVPCFNLFRCQKNRISDLRTLQRKWL